MTTTNIILLAAGVVGLLCIILGIAHFVNKFGFFRRSNKLVKEGVKEMKAQKAFQSSRGDRKAIKGGR